MEIRATFSTNFTALHYFLLVAQAGSFSRAAHAAAVSQPTLGRQVRSLEEELQARLFDRTGRGVVLTPAGASLLEAISPSFRQLELAKRAAARAGSGEQPTQAVIGITPSMGNFLVRPLLAAAHKALPHLRVRIIEGYNRPLLEMLHEGRLDFAVLYAIVPTGGIRLDPLVDEELCLIAPPRRVGTMQSVDMARLGEFPLSLHSQPHGLRQLLDNLAAAHGVTLDVRYEFDTSLSAPRQLAEADLACTILPASAMHEEVGRGTLRALPIRNPAVTRRLVLALPNNRPAAAGVWEFENLVHLECTRLVAAGLWPGARLPGTGPAAG